MVNMIIHGCGGAMGQVLSELAAEDGEIQVAAGIDPRGGIKRDYPVYESFQACGAADVVVDFSTAAAVDGLLEYCKEKRLPLVLCTTGLSQCQLEKVQELSEKDAPVYIKKFAEVKGSTQGMAERLQQLFPPPKAKPQLYVPKKPGEE